MMRAVFISLVLAAPAGAATLSAIQIEECVQISVKDMARDAVEKAEHCYWPGPPINPLPYDMMADIKGPQDTPPSPVYSVVREFLPVATSLLGSSNVQAGTALAPAHSWASAGAFSWSEARCGCVTEPDKPEPIPVPLSGAAWLLAGALGFLAMARRVRG